MLDINAFMSSLDSSPTMGGADSSLQQKLSLYQVFNRLYEQHRTLLDEILNLENSSGETFFRATAAPHVHGFVMDGQVGLVTNLVNGGTQTILQSQHIWTIGRDRRKSVIFVADERLSRCHAAIAYQPDFQAFYLIDFASTNGSFVNGEPIRYPHLLKDGDRIRLGSLSFSFSVSCSVCQGGLVASDVEQTVKHHFQQLPAKPESTPPDSRVDLADEVPREKPDRSDSEVVIDDTLMFLRDEL
ncbi:MAG: FHA domain-containing protein [Elainellaceae cyanobacterium]